MHDFAEIRNNWFIEKVTELRSRGLSLAEIARTLEVMPQYLTPIMAGTRNASEKLIMMLCEKYDINKNDLVSRMRSYDAQNAAPTIVAETNNKSKTKEPNGIPLIPISAMAGQANGDCRILETDIIDRYVVPEFKSRGAEFLIRVSGASMYPKYSNGDLLACKRIVELTFFQWGKVYVLDTDQGPLVKRLFEATDSDHYLECRSDNSEAYPPFTIPKKSVRSIAIVIGVIRLE